LRRKSALDNLRRSHKGYGKTMNRIRKNDIDGTHADKSKSVANEKKSHPFTKCCRRKKEQQPNKEVDGEA